MMSSLVSKVIIDFTLIAIPAFIGLMLNLFVEPFHRGFFCDDKDIMYPYGPNSISILTIGVIGVSFSVALIIIVETALKSSDSTYNLNDSQNYKLNNWKISPYIQNLYHYIGLLLFSMSANQFLTDGTKFVVGRLRPHFLDICRPVLPDGSTCNDQNNYNKYIQDFTCGNSNASESSLKDARISFPSGHTSFAFVTAIYCVFYLESRMKYNGSKMLKHLIQLICVSGALYTGLSRISDYKHHHTDVLAGLILGSLIAYVVCIHLSKLFKRNRVNTTEAQV